MKYANHLDLLVAITSRAPDGGPHSETGRRPGLESSPMTADDLKNVGVAVATTSAVPMIHIAGVTPEAARYEPGLDEYPPERRHRNRVAELQLARPELSNGSDPEVGLVSMGSPHASATEIAPVADLARGRRRHPAVPLIRTTCREIFIEARSRGHIATTEEFGGSFVTDTCWCFIERPIVPPAVGRFVTSSGKFSRYGTARHSVGMSQGSLRACVDAATTGRVDQHAPDWLR